MEKNERSGKEFRKKKKTATALPLGVFLSFNDRDVHPQCPHASNPYHKCGRHCLSKIPSAKNFFDAVTLEEGKMAEGRGRVNPNCPNASNPFHKCAEYCFERLSEKRRDAGKEPAMKPKEEKKAVVIADRGVNSECKNASNPYHVCAEYCFQALPEKLQCGEAIVKAKEERTVNPVCRNASNPYHVCADYCFQNPGSHQPGRVKSNEDKGAAVPLKSGVCKNASNPYHVCAEYCFQNVHDRHRAMMKSKEAKEVVAGVNPECKYASNPYHVCAEYCFQTAPEREKAMKRTGIKQLNKTVEITSVHPRCRYASNPYHQCAEYCFQKNVQIPETVMKPADRKKETSRALRTDAECKNGSNPLHAEKNQAVECIPGQKKQSSFIRHAVMIKEKKQSSPKKETINHPMMENSSMDSEYIPSNNLGEIIILQDGMEKSSMESKDVEQLSTNSNDTDFCKGIITMQDGTNSGVQHLPIDASDLFQEWAKYCFQEKFAEGIIVMQDNRSVERREIATTSDKGNVVLNYESTNLDKAQAKGGSPLSLPASVLFFVGFLFSMFYWTQVIHSLVMSSEKNKVPQRLTSKMHDVDVKCSNVSDPYHKCSECCFRGMGEEMHHQAG